MTFKEYKPIHCSTVTQSGVSMWTLGMLKLSKIFIRLTLQLIQLVLKGFFVFFFADGKKYD